MMLYVFHVDVGRMLTFDMTVALSSVENLKETIQRLHGLPAANIVLLASCGEMLTHSTQVSCYSAGTDTNPIYMFLNDEKQAPTIASGSGSTDATDAELRRQVDESDKLPPVLDTVRQRSHLAQHMRELARKDQLLCERLIHEQHLQQQGWSAVGANIDDLTNDFSKRFQSFCLVFDVHLQNRAGFIELLRNFSDDLRQLARIPILPALMEQAEADFHGFDELLYRDNEDAVQLQPKPATVTEAEAQPDDSVEKSSSSTSPTKKLKMGNDPEESEDQPKHQQHQLNLLQWVSSKGNHSLQGMCNECVQGLETFSEDIYLKLKQEVQNIIKVAKQAEVKEIKGLADRLYRLDEFKYKISKLVQDQREQATALQQNEARALNLRDTSVLPDLCLSHRSQLQVMLDSHIKIREYYRCINNSKEELSRNLQTRLRRIVWLENGMSEFDNRLLFYHRCLQRAERHIKIIEQIHRAPSTYVAAVTEVVRRKIFSDEFRRWATRMSVDFDRIHGEELERRREFNAKFDGHFLNILFPGMSDMPPTFASEHPELSFDTRLPHLNRSDIELLCTQLPEMAIQLQLPDMTPVLQLFMLPDKSISEGAMRADDETETDTETEYENLAAAATNATKQSVSTSTSLTGLNVEKMAQSTETEELLMLSASTLTDENAGSLQRLQDALQSMSKLALQCLTTARSNLSDLRSELATNYQNELQSELQLMQEKWKLLHMQAVQREQQQLDQMEQLRKQLSDAEQEKLAAVAQAREQLIHEHKTELESLRCRFKLMTSMERSPSDTSLEKLERPTSSASVASLEMEQLLAQQRQEWLAQQERAVNEAIEAERAVWQARQVQPQINSESVMANVSVLKDMVEDKERQLDLLRDQNRMVTQECYQLKLRIDMLTNEDGNSWMKEKIDYLSRDKCRLEDELSMEKSRRIEMETSVAAMKNSTYELGAITIASNVSRTKSSCSSHRRQIALECCTKGDIVFVVWSVRHGQFMVVQDSSSLFFVHAESLPGLQLIAPMPPTPGNLPTIAEAEINAMEINQMPLPYYGIGRIIEKEFCQARKDDNRYRVLKGTKFYRIKLAPVPSRSQLRRERMQMANSSAGVNRSQLAAAVRDIMESSDISIYQSFKERTVSTSSVNEEDDESTSVLSDRSRQTTFSEEDEMVALAAGVGVSTITIVAPTEVAATSATTAAATTTTVATQAQSVITEQPTASSKLNLDILLASADITTQPLTQLPQQEQQEDDKEKLEVEAQSEPVADTEDTTPTALTTNEHNPFSDINPIDLTDMPVSVDITTTTATATTTTSTNVPNVVIELTVSAVSALPTSIKTATFSEDSDEYRSLEGRDEADFPISE